MNRSIAYQSIVIFFMCYLVGIHNLNRIYLNKRYLRITCPNNKKNHVRIFILPPTKAILLHEPHYNKNWNYKNVRNDNAYYIHFVIESTIFYWSVTDYNQQHILHIGSHGYWIHISILHTLLSCVVKHVFDFICSFIQPLNTTSTDLINWRF